MQTSLGLHVPPWPTDQKIDWSATEMVETEQIPPTPCPPPLLFPVKEYLVRLGLSMTSRENRLTGENSELLRFLHDKLLFQWGMAVVWKTKGLDLEITTKDYLLFVPFCIVVYKFIFPREQYVCCNLSVHKLLVKFNEMFTYCLDVFKFYWYFYVFICV